MRLQLRVAATDPAACAHAAREGAAVLAAWSIELEGQQPGPLARASRQLARSAELPAYTPAPRRPLSRASGLALFMLAAGRPDSAVGWLLVCRELGLLVGEIGRVHRARGELDCAREIETELHAELEEIRARIDADRPEAVTVELDAETEAPRRARDPLGPATREAPERPDVDDVDAVKRLIDPTPPPAAAALKTAVVASERDQVQRFGRCPASRARPRGWQPSWPAGPACSGIARRCGRTLL